MRLTRLPAAAAAVAAPASGYLKTLEPLGEAQTELALLESWPRALCESPVGMAMDRRNDW
jgi:hypothetical protein